MSKAPQAALSAWLDCIRWISAWAVLIAHVGSVTLVPFASIDGRPEIAHFLYSFTAGFGHQAVIVFFVLSGYLVGGSFLRERKEGRFNFGGYLVKRLIRLWIVIIPAMALVFIIDNIGISTFNGINTGVYLPKTVGELDLTTFACNAAFLQTIACRQYGADGPLWSLSNEFLYYVSFPLLVLAIFSEWSTWVRLIILTSIGSVLTLWTLWQGAGFPIGPYFLMWIIGAVGSMGSKTGIRIPTWAPAIGLIATLLASRIFLKYDNEQTNNMVVFLSDAWLSVLTIGLIYSMKFNDKLRPPPIKSMHGPFSNFSYSLYCIHYPVSLFVAAIMMNKFGTGHHMIPSGASTWLIVGVNILICVGASYIFSLFTEKKTDELRKFVFGLHGKLPKYFRSGAS